MTELQKEQEKEQTAVDTTMESILRSHISRMGSIYQDGLDHLQKVSESQIKLVERYLPPTDQVQNQILPTPPAHPGQEDSSH